MKFFLAVSLILTSISSNVFAAVACGNTPNLCKQFNISNHPNACTGTDETFSFENFSKADDVTWTVGQNARIVGVSGVDLINLLKVNGYDIDATQITYIRVQNVSKTVIIGGNILGNGTASGSTSGSSSASGTVTGTLNINFTYNFAAWSASNITVRFDKPGTSSVSTNVLGLHNSIRNCGNNCATQQVNVSGVEFGTIDL